MQSESESGGGFEGSRGFTGFLIIVIFVSALTRPARRVKTRDLIMQIAWH